jgi:2-dehydropantoate 2-reductase
MKIAVVGCGAVGSYYGSKLVRHGFDVHFLLRSDFETVQREGVQVLSPAGNFSVRPKCARDPVEIGSADLVIVALKTTANDQFQHLLPALVGPRTRLLTLQNGLGNEEVLAALFGPERILGGLCFVCLNRVEPGVISHLAHGQIVLGEFGRPAGPATLELVDTFNRAGIPCRVTDELGRAHWEKLCWNVPFNGLGVAGAVGLHAVLTGHRDATVNLGPCLTTDQLLADPEWEKLIRELVGEVIAGARALGYPLPDSLVDLQIRRTREMGAYKASTLIDFEAGRPLELQSLFLEPLNQARKAGVELPRLAALAAVLADLEKDRAVSRALRIS